MVILHNSITFGLIMRSLLRPRKGLVINITDKIRVQEIIRRLQNAFAISILLGLTWVFGFFAIDKAKRPLQLLFCICNSFQGVMVFLLFCLRQEDVRKSMITKCFRYRPANSAASRNTNSSTLPRSGNKPGSYATSTDPGNAIEMSSQDMLSGNQGPSCDG
jgi:hypothetical protein